jgi:hypothetical protein
MEIFIFNIQGVHKVLEPFVFVISSQPLRAQGKSYCQTKAEILKFMWVRGKSLGIKIKKFTFWSVQISGKNVYDSKMAYLSAL